MYKFYLIIISLLLFLYISCETVTYPIDEPFSTTGKTLVADGTFKSAPDHSASGCAYVYEDSISKYLYLDEFETILGPDLRVYLSKDLEASSFKEAGILKSTIGSFYYTISKNVDVSKYKYVLIWCEDFDVLFGYAKLN